jgi:RNA polymerase sigma factor (sigma-70 family)
MPTPSQIDSVLAELAIDRHDRDAWRSLFEMLWQRVKATTYYALSGRLDLAEDAAQEVFTRLLRYCDFGKFPDAASFHAYLRTVSRNAANDIRREAAWQTVDISEQEVELHRTFPAQSAEDRAAIAELFERIWQFLSEDERILARMISEGYTLAQIGQELHLTENAVSVRWFRLRSRVRNILKTQGIFESGTM